MTVNLDLYRLMLLSSG